VQLLAVVRAPRVLHLNLPETLRPKGGDAVGALRDGLKTLLAPATRGMSSTMCASDA
jgi:hypothetical protein